MAGQVEEFKQLVLHPTDPNTMLLRYEQGNGGLFYTHDGGKSWKLACASMVSPGETLDSNAVMTADGVTLLGSFEGLWQGMTDGCTWGKAAEFAIPVKDVSLHPTDPMVAFGVTAGGADGVTNGLYRRQAGGTWMQVGTKDPALISRVRVVALDGGKLRIYESALRSVPAADPMGVATTSFLIRVSDDEGMTWKEHPLPMMPAGGSFRLEAVDPKKPDRIIASVRREKMPDNVLVSDDQGATFREYLKVTDFGGVTFAPDGRVWIGDQGDPALLSAPKGLWAATSLDAPATQLVSDYNVWCLSYQPATNVLYTCQRWNFGTADVATGAFTKSFDFFAAKSFVTCPGSDPGALCKAQMCAAYCGPMHYAAADLCSIYSDPTCGPGAAAIDRGTGFSPSGGGTGAPSTGGAPAVVASGGTSGGVTPVTPTQSPLPPSTPAAAPSSGCMVQAGHAAATEAAYFAFVIAACWLALRRRARATTP